MSEPARVASRRRAEPTPQQYDPLGALGARPLACAIQVAAVLWAIVASIFARDVQGSAPLSALTVLLVAASATVVIMGTSLFRAPFPRSAFATHMALLAAATVASVAAQWGPDTHTWNDFMPLVVGVGVLVMAPYRPWRDLLIGGLSGSAVVAVTSGIDAVRFPTSVPLLVVICLVAGPPVVLTVASAVFARTFVTLAERVHIRAGSYSVERRERDGIDRSVQEDRVTILERDVIPFFDQLRSQGRISDADRDRARTIADEIRRVMVAEADRTWLEQAIASSMAERGTPAAGSAGATGRGGSVVIDDPDGLAQGMDADQRTVVRTFLRALLTAPTVDPAGVRIAVGRMLGSGCNAVDVQLSAVVADSDVGIHRAFDPYFAVLRVTFHDLDVTVCPSSLALRFSYDQH